MIAEALAVVERDGLIANLIASEAQKRLDEEAENKETQRIATIQAAGVELYEALKLVERDRANCHGGVLEIHAPIIRAAIAKAEGGAS